MGEYWIVILILIILLIVSIMKFNKSPKPKEAIVVCTGGVLKGKKSFIKKGVIIGRDPEHCTEVFRYPSDTMYVSAIHCKLSVDKSDKITLEDCGSSCGTYVNGVQLASHTMVALESGDTFTLGNSINSFVVVK